jgi:hypothetical protein
MIKRSSLFRYREHAISAAQRADLATVLDGSKNALLADDLINARAYDTRGINF